MSATAQMSFDDAEGDHLWTNSANWNTAIPGSTDDAVQTATDGTTLILDSTASVATFNNGNNSTSTFNIVSGGNLTTSGRFDIGNSGSAGVLNVDGGSLSAGGDLQLGRYGSRTGLVNLNSGSITANGQTQLGGWNSGIGQLTINGGIYTANDRFRVGVTGAGMLTMNGGTLNMTGTWGTGNMEIGNGAGDGLLVLNGGTISVNMLTMDSDGAGSARLEVNGGLLDIQNQWGESFNIANGDAEFFVGEGIVTRAGNTISGFTNAVENGYITWDSASTTMQTENWDVSYTNGTGSILFVDYNDANAGKTTMWAAIPEPTALGLIGFVGGSLLWIRRIFTL
ncbi:hypothetical protein [Pontiella desulfatans]|nr:hypothetical protein [Pontiella desulfatans]